MKTIFTSLLFALSVTSFSQWTQYGQTVQLGPDWGYSVSMDDSGDIVATSNPFYNYDGIQQTGLVQVFEMTNNTWIQKGSDIVIESPNIGLGIHVELNPSGDYIVVNGTDQASTYVFNFNGTDWIQVGQVISEVGYLMEASISDDGLTVVTANTITDEIRAYSWNGMDWVQFGSTISLNQFGGHVDMNAQGNKIAVGHIEELYDVVRVFEFTTDWIQIGSDIDGGPYQGMGMDLDLNYFGDALVTSNGSVGLVYEYNGSDWVQKGNAILPTGFANPFGGDVAINAQADRVLFNNPVSNSSEGNGEVFDYQGGTWSTYGGLIEASSPFATSQFSKTLAMNGSGEKLLLSTSNASNGRFETFKDCPSGSINTNVTENNNVLTASATGVTYQWIDCNNGNNPIFGETSQTYAPTTSGSYAVIIDNNGCSATSSCTNITISDPSSISENLENQIRIYPNPSNGIVNIEFAEMNSNTEFQVIDMTGKIILRQNVTTLNNTLDLTMFSKGIYTLKVINEIDHFEELIIIR